LVSLCAHFGHLQVSELHDGNVQPYARERMRHVTAGTVNRELAILVRILNLCVLHLCARRWRNEAGQPYLATVPAIMRAKGRARAPYPISKDEEERLLAECPRHLRQLVLFALHTGCRAGEIIALKWQWEVHLPELGVSVFVLPGSATKNGEERVVLLNSMAWRILDERRGEHDEFVFSYDGRPLSRISNSSWKKAKARAKLPIRFHDLRHTFGHRLRAVGTPLEDRKALLGHTSDEIPTHYSAVGNATEVGRESLACPVIISPLAMLGFLDTGGTR